MKKIGLFVLLFATAGWAQSASDGNAIDAPSGTSPTTNSFPTERVQTPTYADLYCAGFINKQNLPDANYVAGGLQTPTTTKFTRGDMIYLQGTGYSAGAEYEIVRALRDVNEYEMFPGQKKLLKETGQPYEEVGRIKIIDTRSKTAIAQIEYACDGVNPGDTAIPFAEKLSVTFHTPVRFDRFLPPSNKLSGRIVMGKDFDSQLSTGQKLYINVGANQGVKVGDFFRAEEVAYLHSLVRANVNIQLLARTQLGVEILPHHNAAGKFVAGRQETIEAHRSMEGHRQFFSERNCGVPGVDAIARVFDLRDCGLAARVDNLDAAYFFVGLAGFLEEFLLPREHLIFIDVAKSAHDFVLCARAVSSSLEIDHVAAGKFGGCRRLQPTRHVVGVRQVLLVDKPSAIQIGISRRLHPLGWEAIGGRRSSRGSIDGIPVGGRLRPSRGRE